MKLKELLLNGIKDNSILIVQSGEIVQDTNRSRDETVEGMPRLELKEGRSKYPPALFDRLKNTARALNAQIQDETFRDKYLMTFGEEFEFAEDLFFMEIDGNGFDGYCSIRTGNLVGSIKTTFPWNGQSHDLTVQINSRFGPSFLPYLIASSEGFLELERQGGVSQGGMTEWILAYLWKIKLLAAYAVGLPKFYRAFSDDLCTIRGNLRLSEYARQPYDNGRYPCTYRQHSFNNQVSQIINHTFDRLMRGQSAPLLDSCAGVRHVFSGICGDERMPVHTLLKNLHQVRITNPFYLRYKEVLNISKMILRNEYADIWPEEDEFSGFLFDISMLFEHHIRKLLAGAGLSVAPKTRKAEAAVIPTGVGLRRLYPDIIINGPKGTFVLDVKYKKWNTERQRYGVPREDLFQIVAYTSVYHNRYPDLVGCGFFFPIAEGERSEQSLVVKQTLRAFKDLEFYVFFYEIPSEDTDDSGNGNSGTVFDSFRNKMDDCAKKLVDNVKKAVGRWS